MKKKKFPKIFFPLIIFFIFIFSIPYILSTKPLNALILKLQKNKDLSFSKITFSWIGPQKIKEGKFDTEYASFYLEDLIVDTNFISFLKDLYKKRIFLAKKFYIKNGNILVKNSSVQLKDINIEASISSNFLKNSFLKISSKTFSQNKEGFLKSDLSFFKDEQKGFVELENFSTEAMKTFFSFIYKKEKFQRFISILDEIFFDSVKSLKANISFFKNEGTLDLNLSSENLKSFISLNLKKEKILLEKPLIVNFLLTKKLSKYLFEKGFTKETQLKDLYSLKPIFIKIDPRHFSIPRNFSKRNFEKFSSIENGYIDLSKMRQENNKLLDPVISFIGKRDLLKETDIWFSPFIINLKKGILNISRTDILISNRYHICLWGDIDLIEDKVKMNLGITSSFLRKLGVKNLPLNYTMRIPVKGSTSKIKIDTTTFFTKIAALKNKDILGPFSKLIPHITDDQSKIPKPRKPFPWQE